MFFCDLLVPQNIRIKECRGGSRTAATSKVELFVIIVNGFQPLTIITKSSTLDVAAALDQPLEWKHKAVECLERQIDRISICSFCFYLFVLSYHYIVLSKLDLNKDLRRN